jgi:hypothetical protein
MREGGIYLDKNNKKESFELSYESDGKMNGKERKTEKEQKEKDMFFNTTQNSE